MKTVLVFLITLLLGACATTPVTETAADKAANKVLLDQAVALYEQKNYAQAQPLFEQAAIKGQMKASRYLGLMYLNGEGVAKNPQRAFGAFKLAAERGDITGRYWLGYLYEHGIGTAKDLTQAFYWYGQAAGTRIDHVTAPAMTALGRFYEQGIATAADQAKAIEWYRKAASTGDADAQAALQRLGVQQ